MAVKEAVLDACEEASILPEIRVVSARRQLAVERSSRRQGIEVIGP